MEDGVLGELSRAVHVVFKTHSAAFLPFFHQGLLSTVSGMLHTPTADAAPGAAANNVEDDSGAASRSLANQAKQWSICVFDDLMEFCGAHVAWEFRQYYWESLLNGVTLPSSPDVRQACCYGLGTLAHKASVGVAGQETFDLWVGSLLDALNVLFVSLTLPWARHPDHTIANENAIAAIGKMLHYVLEPVTNGPAAQVPVEQFHQALRQWIQCLPIVEDEEEMPHTYGYLLELLQQQHPVLVEDLTVPLRVMVEAVASGALQRSTASWPGYGTANEVGTRMVEAIRAVLGVAGDAVRASLWASLDDDKRSRLASMGFV
jgi:hypothetical protein